MIYFTVTLYTQVYDLCEKFIVKSTYDVYVFGITLLIIHRIRFNVFLGRLIKILELESRINRL